MPTPSTFGETRSLFPESDKGQRIERQWLDDRIGGEMLRSWLREKTVPVHRHTVWYYFGGMTLFLFVIQAFTGILLLLYYRPTAESAFESVQFIMAEVRFGWLIRSLHSWSANLMILTLFIHMASVYLTRAYRKPRELTWLSGVALLIIALGFGFSGYLLPWNKLAFFATQVGTEIVANVPVIGSFLLTFLRGGENVTGATLTRFFGFHVAVLPALTTAVLGGHILLVQLHGMSAPAEFTGDRKMSFFPNFLLRDIVGWLIALGTLAALAAIFPWELGEKADPFAPAPKGIRPEWFFVWMFQTLKIVPAHIGAFEGEQLAIAGFGLLLILIAAVPFLDNDEGRRSLARFFTAIGWVLLFYILIMTMSAYLDTSVLAAGLPQTRSDDACTGCHGGLDGELKQPVTLFQTDIHRERGLSCADCHGDNHAPAPRKNQIGAFCAKCHSDLNYMRKFNPQMRTDQFTEYKTSVHGIRNARGDENAATCVSCHSVHDIRSVRNPRSPVYPGEVASTCSKCHSDAKRMAAYNIPTYQFEQYRKSVHAHALIDQRDLAAPTCNDCHGNHGARPPGIDSVGSVCSQCHRQEGALFAKSPHEKAFKEMGLAACITCHENHEVRKTDDRMLGVHPGATCAACHSDDNGGGTKIRTMQTSILGLRLGIDTAAEIVARAARAGMEVSKSKFDLQQADADLVKARVAVHAFNPEAITSLTVPAGNAVESARTAGYAALDEVAFRRRGLGYSLIGIAIMIVALILKIREIESKAG